MKIALTYIHILEVHSCDGNIIFTSPEVGCFNQIYILIEGNRKQ